MKKLFSIAVLACLVGIGASEAATQEEKVEVINEALKIIGHTYKYPDFTEYQMVDDTKSKLKHTLDVVKGNKTLSWYMFDKFRFEFNVNDHTLTMYDSRKAKETVVISKLKMLQHVESKPHEIQYKGYNVDINKFINFYNDTLRIAIVVLGQGDNSEISSLFALSPLTMGVNLPYSSTGVVCVKAWLNGSNVKSVTVPDYEALVPVKMPWPPSKPYIFGSPKR